jgi:predicted dienelactone hydrolase
VNRLVRLRRIALRLLVVSVAVCVIVIVGLGVWLGIAHTRSVTLPSPTGQYAVGRIAFDWTDQSRADPFSTALTHRELPVWVWYPSLSPPRAETVPYLPPQWVQLYGKENGIGSWLQQNPNRVRAHAVPDAPPAQGRYPVLVFEPGLGKKPRDYTALLEDLASHGYIVVGIFPTDSTDVVFPDGRTVASANAARGRIVPDQLLEAVMHFGGGVHSVDEYRTQALFLRCQ